MGTSFITYKQKKWCLEAERVIQMQMRLWEEVLSVGKTRNRRFSRTDITKHLEPTSDYMYRVGCTFDQAYCKSKICRFTNPNCAVRKAQGVITVLQKLLDEMKGNDSRNDDNKTLN